MRSDATSAEPEHHSDHRALPVAAGSRRRIVIVALAVGWLAGVLWRVWLGQRIPTPIGHADEDSYLNVARAIAGGPTGFSSETPLFRRVGYPLLISPAYALGLDFPGTYRVVQLINAIVNAAALPLAYLVARRMFRLRRRMAIAAAFAAGTLPAVTTWSLMAMTDAVMAPLLLGWLLTVHRWLQVPGRGRAAAAAGTLSGLLYLTHVRGTVLAAVFGGLLVFLAVRRRAGAREIALAVAPLLGAILLNQTVILLLGDAVRLTGDIAGMNTVQVLTSGPRLRVLVAACGTHLWYLCVVTAGLAGIAWAATAAELWRPRRDPAFRGTAAVAAAGTLGVALGSALTLAGLVDTNSDAIYSRYVQMFAPFWLLFGLAVLLDADLRTALRRAVVPAAVLIAGGALIALRLRFVEQHGHRLSYGFFGAPDLMTITAGWRQFRPILASVIGLTGCVLLITATRVRRPAVAALAVVLVANLATMALMRERIITTLSAQHVPAQHLSEVGVRAPDRVALTRGLPTPLRFTFHHEVTWMEPRLFRDAPPAYADVVVARWYPGEPKDWDGAAYGFRRIAGSPPQHWAVWRRQ